jgi:hypothetical protein
VNQTDYKAIRAFILGSKEFDDIAHSQACSGLPGASAVAPLVLRRCSADAMLKTRHAPVGLANQSACAVHCAMDLGRAAMTPQWAAAAHVRAASFDPRSLGWRPSTGTPLPLPNCSSWNCDIAPFLS